MNVFDIHSLYNRPFKSTDLLKLIDTDDDLRGKYNIPNNKEINRICEKYDIDINYLFFNRCNEMVPICFYKNTVYVQIDIFEEGFIRDTQVAERISVQLNVHQELIDEKDFASLFAYVDTRILFNVYRELLDEISHDEKYDLFIDIYVKSDYGFGEFLSDDFIKEIIKYKKDNKEELIKKLKVVDGYIEIYRGAGSKSSKINEAYSWSTDINKALFFANRFNQLDESYLYKTKVKIDDIIDYLEDRDEEEILILPEKIKDVECTILHSLEDIINSEIINEYHYKLDELNEDYFINPDGIHGVLHAKRVLMLSIILSKLNDIDYIEYEILCDAALFHDIGRFNDDADETHGKLSFDKLKKLNIIDRDESYLELLRYVISEHSVNDKDAFRNIANYNINDREKAKILLKLFKDADALDRVRLQDLDANYLRNKHSLSLYNIAKALLMGIR